MTDMNDTPPLFSGLDLLASAVLVLDAGLLVRYVNPAGENLLAVSLRTSAGKPLSALCACPATLQAALDNARNDEAQRKPEARFGVREQHQGAQ